MFDEVYLLTGGGPGTSTEVVSFTLYQRFFTEDRLGYGSAMSVAVIFSSSLLLVIALAARRSVGTAPHERAPRIGARSSSPRISRSSLSALIVVLPVVWIVAAGFRTQISLLMGEVLFTPVADQLRRGAVLEDLRLPAATSRNSLVVGVVSTLLVLVVGDARRLVAAPHALAALGRPRASSAGR